MSVYIIKKKNEGEGVVQLGPLRWWADRGLIHVEDARDNSYESFPVKEILLRMNGLNEMIGRSKRGGGKGKHTDSFTKYFDELKVTQDFIDDMVTVCRRAQEQGMPSDPDARKEAKRRKPTTVIMPGSMDRLPM